MGRRVARDQKETTDEALGVGGGEGPHRKSRSGCVYDFFLFFLCVRACGDTPVKGKRSFKRRQTFAFSHAEWQGEGCDATGHARRVVRSSWRASKQRTQQETERNGKKKKKNHARTHPSFLFGEILGICSSRLLVSTVHARPEPLSCRGVHHAASSQGGPQPDPSHVLALVRQRPHQRYTVRRPQLCELRPAV